jgi:hypothetical protein
LDVESEGCIELNEFEVGSFIDVGSLPPLHSRKLPFVGKQSRLFIRQSMVDVCSILDKGAALGCWLIGSPGTGKSETGRLWACAQAMRGKSVLFGEVRGERRWITRVEPWSGRWTQHRCTFEQLHNLLYSATEANNPGQIVVLDGAASYPMQVRHMAEDLLFGSGVVVISSGQMNLKQSTPDVEMPGWSLEEIMRVANDERIFASTVLSSEVDFGSHEAFVSRKYELCGPSIRLMLEHTWDAARKTLDSRLQELNTEEQKMVLFGSLTGRHWSAKNLLVQAFVSKDSGSSVCKRYDPDHMKRSFLSKYVLSSLRSALDSAAARRLLRHCETLNPSMRGWAFEEVIRRWIIDCVNESKQISVRLRAERASKFKLEQWPVGAVAVFERSNPNKHLIEGLSISHLSGERVDFREAVIDVWPRTEWNFPTLDHFRLLRGMQHGVLLLPFVTQWFS